MAPEPPVLNHTDFAFLHAPVPPAEMHWLEPIKQSGPQAILYVPAEVLDPLFVHVAVAEPGIWYESALAALLPLL